MHIPSVFYTILRFLTAQLLTQGSGAIGALANTSKGMLWYEELIKPALTPPSWLFAPVWTTLYFFMGCAFFLAREAAPSKHRSAFLFLFLVHLLPLTLWSWAFFGLQALTGSVALIALVLLSSMTLGILSWRINPVISVFLLPYFLWVVFASYLNISLWLINL